MVKLIKENPLDETKEDYQLFVDERKILIEGLRESAKTFDKAMLMLTSGAFGFTVAFLKDVAPKPFENTLWLLSTSWILFAASLIIILVSFLTSQKACQNGIEIAYENIVKKNNKLNCWATATEILNYISIVTLTLAIALWGSFAYFNIHYIK